MAELAANQFVVDADVHLSESPAELASYCDRPWRRVLEEPGHHHVPWSNGGQTFPHLGPRSAPARPASSPVALRARLDQSGVDAALLLPDAMLKIATVPTRDYAAAVAGAYNRWLIDRWLSDGDRLYGAVLAPPQDPERAAREIERAAEHERIVAVVVPTSNVEPLLGDRAYDPIYAAADGADLPVVLHGYPGLMIPGSPHLITPFASDFDQEPIGQSLMALAHLNRIVGTGVIVRYPRLRLLFLGAGITWLMHAALRFDKEYLETRRDVPWFTDRVSGYLREKVWVGTQPMEGGHDPSAMADLIALSCGIERVVYGSSWPHAGFDEPAAVAAGLVDDEARRRVLGANAAELFGIGPGGRTRPRRAPVDAPA